MTRRSSGAGRIFNSTARYYTRYRLPYPEELFTVLREKFGLDSRSRVLDLGCGPGLLALPLAATVGRVFGVDPNEEMLAEAKRLAGNSGITNIEWLLAESRDLPELVKNIAPVNLTVMGSSFHWMNREQTLRDLYAMTVTGGGVAVIDNTDPIEGKRATWRDLTWEVMRRWLGEDRRAGPDRIYSVPKTEHGKILQESPFRDFEVVRIPIESTWTLDEVIGYLFSTSHCSPAVLGVLKDGFERDMRKELLAYDPSGHYYEKSSIGTKMAWKR